MLRVHIKFMFISFFMAIATSIFPVFLPIVFKNLGLSNVMVGFSLALCFVVAALFSIVFGWFEERINKGKMFTATLFAYPLLPIFYSMATGLASILFIRVFAGLIASARDVSRYAILQVRSAKQTGILVSLTDSLRHLGDFIGPALAGFLIVKYSTDAMFYLSAGLLFATALYSFGHLKVNQRIVKEKVNLFEMLKGVKRGKKQGLSNKAEEEMLAFKRGLMNWGSEELIQNYLEFDAKLISSNDDRNEFDLLKDGDKFLKDLRKEMGFNDTDKVNIMSIILTAEAREELSEKSK